MNINIYQRVLLGVLAAWSWVLWFVVSSPTVVQAGLQFGTISIGVALFFMIASKPKP